MADQAIPLSVDVAKALGGFEALTKTLRKTSTEIREIGKNAGLSQDDLDKLLRAAGHGAEKAEEEVEKLDKGIEGLGDAAKKSAREQEAAAGRTKRAWAGAAGAGGLGGIRREFALLGSGARMAFSGLVTGGAWAFGKLYDAARWSFTKIKDFALWSLGKVEKAIKWTALAAMGIGAAAVRAAYIQRTSLTELDRTLRSVGTNYDAYKERLGAIGEEVNAVSRYDDDDVREILSAVIRTGLVRNVREAERFILPSINFAAVSGMAPGDAAEQLARTLGGSTGMIARYIPAIGARMRELGPERGREWLQRGGALETVMENYGGAAYSARLANPWGVVGQRFENALKSLGQDLLPWADRIAGKVIDLLTLIGNIDFASWGRDIFEEIRRDPQAFLAKIGRTLGQIVGEAFRTGIELAKPALLSLGPTLGEMLLRALEASGLSDWIRTMPGGLGAGLPMSQERRTGALVARQQMRMIWDDPALRADFMGRVHAQAQRAWGQNVNTEALNRNVADAVQAYLASTGSAPLSTVSATRFARGPFVRPVGIRNIVDQTWANAPQTTREGLRAYTESIDMMRQIHAQARAQRTADAMAGAVTSAQGRWSGIFGSIRSRFPAFFNIPMGRRAPGIPDATNPPATPALTEAFQAGYSAGRNASQSPQLRQGRNWSSIPAASYGMDEFGMADEFAGDSAIAPGGFGQSPFMGPQGLSALSDQASSMRRVSGSNVRLSRATDRMITAMQEGAVTLDRLNELNLRTLAKEVWRRQSNIPVMLPERVRERLQSQIARKTVFDVWLDQSMMGDMPSERRPSMKLFDLIGRDRQRYEAATADFIERSTAQRNPEEYARFQAMLEIQRENRAAQASIAGRHAVMIN